MKTRHDNISRIVRIQLADKGYRQADLAAALGFDTGSMSRSMNGGRKWSIDDVERMADFFDCSVALFFEDPDSIVRNRWHAATSRQGQDLALAR